ncbi:putative salicylate hydroxylase [Thelonectria olida]|uniref:Salicylate hydroxylase n=1 Tax=Thelonectria olida TaxID=1576542 RepID=A0A9P8W6I9_9HYPO|nr:putative salicylate hydroxylase [Thelonectria olida]
MGSFQRLDYAIIGGGIAGLTLAIALHHRGVSVKIYEQAAQFGEIGAGVSFTPNAVHAMKICHPGVHDAFEKVCTRNLWPEKQKVWFDYYDGQTNDVEATSQKPAFAIGNDLGQNGVHRAHFLDELVKLVPPEIASFGKRLDRYEQDDGGKYTLFFVDGSTAKADAILACDGIKSRVRQCLFGADHPCALPSYTHKYAYRALVPMEDAVAAVGKEKAQNAGMHMGKGGHVLTFPVNRGQTLNVVAFHTTSSDWPDASKLTAPAKRQDALKDFAGFGDTITSLLKLAKEDLDIWAIFDLGDNPPPTFTKGRACLVGDAAHATSPHHGAGAGLCIEDAAVLAHILSDKSVTSYREIETALEVYDSARRDRGSWLVQSSRRIGNTYEWLVPGIEDDLGKVEAEIKHRNGIIANVNVQQMCDDARTELGKRLSTA